MDYTIPQGVHDISTNLLDLRPDSKIEHDLLHPKPVTDEKNVWFFWHSGYMHMHSYTKRNVRAWHRRFSKSGWSIRVLDRSPSSPSNVEEFLDINDPETFPQAFINGTIGGDHAPQHTSDLVRFPLLLKYGGVYADVGLMQIGNLDRLWNMTVGDPTSGYEVVSYNAGDANEYDLTNHFIASARNNRFFARCHRLLLALWAEDGGKASTDGMHRSLLLKGCPLIDAGTTMVEDGKTISREDVNVMLTDYIIQGQAMRMVMGMVDPEDGWNGPEYVTQHVYAIHYMTGSQLINQYTSWDGQKAFELMSLSLPKPGQAENSEHKQAREIVEACLSKSFGFKLAHGIILKVLGPTLGSLWRKHTDSDDKPGTYAHWLRYGMVHWEPDEMPVMLKFDLIEPFKTGPLLRAE